MEELRRVIYIIGGQVQGVGFRPFIFREAQCLGLTGSVQNTPEGVRIEVQGTPSALASFSTFSQRLPPLARISSVVQHDADVVTDEGEFKILLSSEGSHRGHAVLVSPDVAPCAHCLADMSDPGNRRFGYAFTNCTDCGPRYTITTSIPYDRPVTSMACFPLCRRCSDEYHSPSDRRFHAQPNACPECGPMLWLERADPPGSDFTSAALAGGALPFRLIRYGVHGAETTGDEAVLLLLRELSKGRIAAVKGLGGFHLVCDARNTDAIQRLRERKHRPHKPLAVMAADIDAAAHLADIGPQGSDARILLGSPCRPIVICPHSSLPRSLSPDTGDIGLMLPSTPLHHLLFHPELCGGDAGDSPDCLVMTSGNPPGTPLCIGNREARRMLDGIADLFLFHDRDIVVRADDSVVFPAWPDKGLPSSGIIRRARGYTPAPSLLPAHDNRKPDQSILGVGAELKSTFCLTRGKEAFVSQHIGDLATAECFGFYEKTFRHFLSLLEVTPQLIVRDLHPDYSSTLFAKQFSEQSHIPLIALQHHVAHICAVMAEHTIAHTVIGIALDGTGYGGDGTLWGGELLLVGPCRWQRIGRFSPILLPGGEAAIRSPWRIAEALCMQHGIIGHAPWHDGRERLRSALHEMIDHGMNCPETSSCGRLFDAVSALGGLCFDITYEGQAAIRLEQAQDANENGYYDLPIAEKNTLLEADVHVLFREAAGDRDRPGIMARRFHRGLAKGLAKWACKASETYQADDVILAGGVFNNRTLLAETMHELSNLGLNPVAPSAFPFGDGAISLGQAYWGDLMLCAGKGAGDIS
ncbi:MAG: carbamoyltransferase HypF [Mailhella sp.]|nr:carbamoyltransferase HypF [Mailhella sp.]